ncbi:GAF domain-containing protein [Paenibacillus sp. WLX1005]|uniref:GAF domain-containing protein n=1 Tax=unclassified Paenibacillus TaxID=185978 RepID=UPI0039843578
MNDKVDYQQELDEIRALFGYDFMALALAEPAEYHYVIKWKYASGNLNERFRDIVLQSGRGVAGMVFKTGKPFMFASVQNDVPRDALFNYPIIRTEQLTSLGAVPVWNDTRVAGVLLGGYRDERRVDRTMMQALNDLAHQGIGELNGKEYMPS